MAALTGNLETRMWEAADQLWANSSLRPAEFSGPVLGLIFLSYATARFERATQELVQKRAQSSQRARPIQKIDYEAHGVLYIPEEARFSTVINLPEGADIGKALNEAMKKIEGENPELRGILPQNFTQLEDFTLIELMRIIGSIPMDIEGDAFGKIYEYFLGKLAKKEGQKGGEFFTPESLVKLIVEVLEPFHGRIFDPASGSGGMFIQSGRFVANHRKNPTHEISIYGQEKVEQTIRLSKMNLAVHGLMGDIRKANTYYEDPHDSVGKFDFVMSNPPFNVSGVDTERIESDPRFAFGIPNANNANYLWIQQFYHALNETGKAGFVMANSAADARGTELEIRKKIINSGAVDLVISIGQNFFYTVALPCTLWFFDRAKSTTVRVRTVLFIDARKIYSQVDRAHREFTPAQIEFIANIARIERGEAPEFMHESKELFDEHFPDGNYHDVPGLCKVATLEEIKEQGWSLNPGRYVGIRAHEEDGFDFMERLEELNEELEVLTAEARELEGRISENVVNLLDVI